MSEEPTTPKPDDDASREPTPKRTKAPRRTLARRVLRGLGFAALAIVLLVALGVGFLHTSAGAEVLRARVEARLNERVTTKVAVGALRFSLLNGVTLENLVVHDREDGLGIAIQQAAVAPRLGDLVRGTIALEDVKVTGVRVTARQYPDGTTNLTGLLKPSPPPPPGAAAPESRHVVVDALSIADVSLYFQKVDGLVDVLEGVSLDAQAIDVWTGRGTVRGEATLRVRRASVKRPGLTLAVNDIVTGARASLEEGNGQIAIGPTGADIGLTRPDAPAVATKLTLPGVTVDVTKERIGVALEALEIAALSLAAAKVELAREADGGRRVTSANVTRLTVRAKDVDALAGRPVLSSDLVIDVDASGPPEAFTPTVRVSSDGGEIKLRASLDLRDADVLRYDATLSSSKLDVARITPRVPSPLTIGSLEVTAKGERRADTPPKVTATVAIRDLVVRSASARSIDARARLEGGTLTIESLAIDALEQHVGATGTYRLEDKAVDVTIRAGVRVRELVAELRRAGLLTTPPSPLATALALRGPAVIRVTGRADGELLVHVSDVDARIAGGSARAGITAHLVRGDTTKGEKAVSLRDVEADVELRSVSLAELGRLRGKALPVSGRASGRVRVHGSAEQPEAEIDLDVALTRPEDPRARVATMRVKGAATGTRIDAHATLTSESGAELAAIDVKGARAGRGIGAPLTATIDVPRRSLAEIGALLRPEIREKLPADVTVGLQGRVRGDHRTTVIEIDARAEPKPGKPPITIRARADVAGAATRLATAPARWSLDVEMPETPLSDLPLPAERAAGLRGAVALAVHARGTRDDVTGDVTLDARGLGKDTSPSVDAVVKVAVADDATTLTTNAKASELDVLEGAVRVALGGRGLLAKAKRGALAGIDPAIQGELRVPEHRTDAWARLTPRAAALPGRLGGDLDVSGSLRDPELALHVGYAGYRTLAGDEGTLTVDAKGRAERATVRVALNDKVTLSAELSPRAILEAKRAAADGQPREARVTARLDAKEVPLAALLPDAEALRASQPEGTLDAALSADASLVFRGDARELGALDLQGPLTVKGGALKLPETTWRRIHGIDVAIRGDGERLVVSHVTAKESDREEPNRHVHLEGAYAIRDRALTLHAKTHRVLLSGGNFGMLDAPRAALTAELDVRADLSGPVKRVWVDVEALDLDSGDRQPRAVQQEVLGLGDVLDVGPGVTVGKLPVGPRPSVATTEAEQPPKAEDKTLELVVRVAKPIHVKQRPLELVATGEIRVERYGERRVLEGGLRATGGSLLVGGRLHPLERGEVRMTNDGPMFDLHFQRPAHPAALRDMTTADGTDVKAHMVGPMSKPKISFSGKADGLFEALALEGIGRVRVLSTPDRPAAQTTQLPLVPQIRQTAFMSANLPHLAFLDRTNVFADPNASRFAYGRFEDLEAERYSVDGTRRLRTTVRPPVIGQSDAEVEGSLLFTNDPRVISGVGILGGTRLGGGPTLFLEWSSAD